MMFLLNLICEMKELMWLLVGIEKKPTIFVRGLIFLSKLNLLSKFLKKRCCLWMVSQMISKQGCYYISWVDFFVQLQIGVRLLIIYFCLNEGGLIGNLIGARHAQEKLLDGIKSFHSRKDNSYLTRCVLLLEVSYIYYVDYFFIYFFLQDFQHVEV